MEEKIVQGRSSVVVRADSAGPHQYIYLWMGTKTIFVHDGEPIEVPIHRCSTCTYTGTPGELATMECIPIPPCSGA